MGEFGGIGGRYFRCPSVDRQADAASIDVLPQQKNPKLIVVVAFDRGDDGELFPAFGPADQQSEELAIRTARSLADKHAGVIAWSREAHPEIREYGPPTTLFVSGDVQDME